MVAAPVELTSTSVCISQSQHARTSPAQQGHRLLARPVDRCQPTRAQWFRQLAGLFLGTVLAQPNRARAAKQQEKPKKVALITGASTGIGKATAEQLCRSGMYSTVLLAGHNEAKTEATIQELSPLSSTKLEFLPLELASFQSVREAVKEFQQMQLPLHTLVCNAAVMALPERQVSSDGNELQLEVGLAQKGAGL